MYNSNKHHRRSIRLQNWSYANIGAYFVTICCQNRKCIFGKIVDKKMILNEYGEITGNAWNKLPQHHTNIELGAFIVMPNHIHGIITINTTNIAAVTNHDNNRNNRQLARYQNPGKNTLSSIVGSYKSTVSKQIHRIGFVGDIWQRNFYEHVIRNEIGYAKITEYIRKNPVLWRHKGKAGLAPT